MNPQVTLQSLLKVYPGLRKMKLAEFEYILAGLSEPEITEIEEHLDTVLPDSYKRFLRICAGFWHDGIKIYEPFSFGGEEAPLQRSDLLCFADTFILADGDQSLFDMSGGLVDGEYPIVYYDHEMEPPRLVRISDTFEDFLNNFLPNPESVLD